MGMAIRAFKKLLQGFALKTNSPAREEVRRAAVN